MAGHSSARVARELNVDPDKLNQLMEKFVGEMGAAMNAALVLIGEKLGLYKAMAGAGPLTAEQVAERTGTDPRYVREWLSAQAAGDFVTYNPETQTFTLPDEQAFALAIEDSPAYIPGAFQIISAVMKDEPKIAEAFRTGDGVGWDEHDTALFEGTERFFRPNYAAHLVNDWIPALEGVTAKLERGARVADVGCGHGASTILMAQAFPNSQFVGFDYHGPSIGWARRAANRAGVTNAKFEVATASDFHGAAYDLVAFFDCLHDMGDPIGAARHVREMLKPDGTWMIVEPFANDRLENNLNPIGRVYYAASTMICTPASRAQEVGLCLGAQAGEERIRKVVGEGGFRGFRRATDTPFNIVYEARP
ncbi:MAG TPA: class I SAM-dependent methyltransferase [Bryobacteraceae bacterium]|nr:class I SAM-dependent methyltransferase [Bryobacteraceae bacterium]